MNLERRSKILREGQIMSENSESQQQVTQYLQEWSQGDEAAGKRLFNLVYEHCHHIAESYLRRERHGHTLQATALVNEAFMKLVDQERVQWQNRGHFYAIAAQAMRRILVDYARTRSRQKRGGGARRVELTDGIAGEEAVALDVIALHEALEKLALLDARQAKIVELRFFGGLEMDQIGQIMGISKRTVEGDWAFARAWLRQQMSAEPA